MSSTPELVKETEVIDPVCGMSILPSSAAGHVEHDGRDLLLQRELRGEVPADADAFLA